MYSTATHKTCVSLVVFKNVSFKLIYQVVWTHDCCYATSCRFSPPLGHVRCRHLLHPRSLDQLVTSHSIMFHCANDWAIWVSFICLVCVKGPHKNLKGFTCIILGWCWHLGKSVCGCGQTLRFFVIDNFVVGSNFRFRLSSKDRVWWNEDSSLLRYNLCFL